MVLPKGVRTNRSQSVGPSEGHTSEGHGPQGTNQRDTAYPTSEGHGPKAQALKALKALRAQVHWPARALMAPSPNLVG